MLRKQGGPIWQRIKNLLTKRAELPSRLWSKPGAPLIPIFDYVKQAISATPSGGNEFAERLKECAERNITMTQEYLRQFSQARNFQDVVRVQTNFMQSLMNAAAEQTRSLAEAYTKTAADTAKKPVSGMS